MQQGLLQLLGKNKKKKKIFLALVSTGGGGEENWENTNSNSWKQKCLSICGWGNQTGPSIMSVLLFRLQICSCWGKKKDIKAIDLKVLRWSWGRYVYYQQLIIAFLEMCTLLCKRQASWRNCSKAWLKLPYCWEITVGFHCFPSIFPSGLQLPCFAPQTAQHLTAVLSKSWSFARPREEKLDGKITA